MTETIVADTGQEIIHPPVWKSQTILMEYKGKKEVETRLYTIGYQELLNKGWKITATKNKVRPQMRAHFVRLYCSAFL